MYLQSFEERSSASGADRRRNVRVKPDELGRFKFDDFAPRAAETSVRAAKNPWAMAIGGAVVGAVMYSILLGGHGHDGPSPVSAETQAAETKDGKAERNADGKRDDQPSKQTETASRHDGAPKAASPKPRTIPAEEMLPRPVTTIAAKPAGDAARPDANALPELRQTAVRDVVVSAQVMAKPEYSIVPVETAGAMVPMAGPDEAGAGADEGLQVMQ